MPSVCAILSSWWRSASVPYPPSHLGGCSPSLGVSGLMAGSGAVCGWGSPRLLQRGTRISNTCSHWQPATSAHCLPTSHFNLKRENCQTNVLATGPCQGCIGNLTAAPARSGNWGVGDRGRGSQMLGTGGASCLPSALGLTSSEYRRFPGWESIGLFSS